MVNIKLGNKLRELRKKRNLKQSEVAELTNLNVKTIQRYEKGENIPERFLHLFVEKLGISRNDKYELMDIIESENISIDEQIEKIFLLLGYKIKIVEDNEFRELTVIENTNLNKFYLLENYNFYDEILPKLRKILVPVFRALIESEIDESQEINSNYFNYLDTEEYKKIIKKYEGIELELLTNATIPNEKELAKIKKLLNSLDGSYLKEDNENNLSIELINFDEIDNRLLYQIINNLKSDEIKKAKQKEIEELKQKLNSKNKK